MTSKYLPAVLAMLAAGLSGCTLSPDAARLVEAGEAQWAWILLALCLAWALFRFVRNQTRRGETVMWALTASLALFLASAPFQSWLHSGDVPRDRAPDDNNACTDASVRSPHRCVVTADWSNWVKDGDDPQASGVQLCVSRGVTSQRKADHGTVYWRFTSNSGKVLVQYQMQADPSCPNPLPAVRSEPAEHEPYRYEGIIPDDG